MCGIAGGIFWGDVPADRADRAIQSMVSALGHRGPDGRGCSRVSGAPGQPGPVVVLGHTRLAIIDVSPAGAQPMGGDGTAPWITYNGETYNFVDLRNQLEERGGRFTSQSDTEVLLRAYDEWGREFVERVRGMFAFALWDPGRKQLLLARDRFGIKPLYYFAGDGFLLFASEVRALLTTGLVPRRLDATALWQYLGYQSIPAPRTLVAGVRLLEPGNAMTVTADGRRTQREYWSLLQARESSARGVSETTARRRVGELLRESVAAHMVSDVPVGAFLSGGIDSSAVVALMRDAGYCPRTFSIGFAERAFDESEHAALVARTFRADHTHIPLSEAQLLDQLPEALRAMDLPSGDGINTYLVSRAVREKGISVALSGLGGDELFGGYPSFSRLARIAEAARFWGRSPAILRSAAATAVRTVGRSSVTATKAAAAIESDGSLAAMFPLTRQVLSVEQRLAMLEQQPLGAVADRSDPYDRLLAGAFDASPDADLFAQVSFAETRTYMHDVLLRDTDQMSMAHALEVRVPLLDHLMAEYVVALPDAFKASDGTPKRLLVESLEGLLPPAIVHRPKQGFTLPFEPWMRGAMRSFCDERLGASGLSGRRFFRAGVVERLWGSFLNRGKDVTWSRLWLLVVLEEWLERNGEFDEELAA
jgi:asparagine synthase (glutamine-hydrolysing)